MDAFNNLSNVTNSFATAPARIDYYHQEISYDPNGNIKSYLRNGTTQGSSLLGMDSLTYQYEKLANGQIKSNKLRYVHDLVTDANYATEDINSQKASTFTVTDVQNDISGSVTSDNYEYDAIGNLIKDTKEGITNIEWTVYGKISKITKSSSIISYSYDASGNRISKVFSSGGIDKATYYVRDASGNVMSVYTRDSSTATNTIIAPLSQTELHLYGSSRLGVYNVNVDVQNCLNTPNPITIFSRGNKFFELSNHLGNALVTISDKKLQVQDPTTPASILFYNADVVTANDYYPGGMLMPGRKYQAGSGSYRYGFNGKENDNEVKGEGNQQDYGMRTYDPRIGKFLSVDPLTKDFPELTPYQFASNSPSESIDLDGLESLSAIKSGLTRQFEAQKKLTLTPPKAREVEILVWNPYRNQAQIRKASVLRGNIAAARTNYYNAVGENIRGGFFGAAGYMLKGEQGSFYGAAMDGVAMSFAGIPAARSSVFPKVNIGPAPQKFVPNSGMQVVNSSGGAARSAKYSSEWGNGSLVEIIRGFGANPVGVVTSSGKTIYKNSETGIQIIADNGGNYFRIQNVNIIGKRNYLNIDGTNPTNKVENGKTSGRTQAEYNQLTHFNNTDPK